MRFAFITGTPLDYARGSGTYAGISTLARSVEARGHTVEIIAPHLHLPVYTAERLLFNEQLRRRDLSSFDTVVGFDMDGYRLKRPHVAAIKGVIADEMRFERGITRWTMSIQARCERSHVMHAERVLTTSCYAARRILDLYGAKASVVPECIDLAAWRAELARAASGKRTAGATGTDAEPFTVLTVCRFYPRKRVDVMLRAAALLPEVRFRIVGGGPENPNLRSLADRLHLGRRITWLGNITREALAREYAACHAFCLPSVQEGFGIVFLEAMAAGKPVIAAKAAAVPEVMSHGLLVEPGEPEPLAAAIERLRISPGLRAALSEGGLERVEQFDAPRVAGLFLEAIGAAAGDRAIAAAARSNR